MDERIKRSRKQEKRGAHRFSGKVTPGSGNGEFAKGDVRTPHLLIEYKRTDKDSISLKADWLEKIREEAILDGRSPVMGIQVGGQNWVLIPEDDYVELLESGGDEPT